MKLFSEENLFAYFDRLRQTVEREILNEKPDWLLNVNETQYLAHLAAKYAIAPLSFDFDGKTVTPEERVYPPDGVYLAKVGQRVQVITFHIPFTGEPTLLRMRPSRFRIWNYDAVTTGHEVCFEINDFNHDAKDVARQAEAWIKFIRDMSENVSADLVVFNNGIGNLCTATFQRRKKEILQQRALVEALGVPVKRADEVPSTFKVPVVRKPIVMKPVAPSGSYKPEPALDAGLYRDILEVVNDFGRNMERHPSTYYGKDEEAIRDLLIMLLSPHFQSVMGETFNKSGKTDILIRHEGQNVFVAECKFWRGEKEFGAAVDQCLSYLTWRDSKAAIINFVPNKSLQPVLNQVPVSLRNHNCFDGGLENKREGWVECKMHLPKDSTRGVHLAVLSFHLPSD